MTPLQADSTIARRGRVPSVRDATSTIAGNALETARVGDTGAAKLMDHPGLGVGAEVMGISGDTCA